MRSGAPNPFHRARTWRDPAAKAALVQERLPALWALASPCRLCPRRCGAARREGETGRCGVGRLARVASFGPHFGEERPLVGSGGSGTIFFGGCNLLCSFCQNDDISHVPAGEETGPKRLAGIMLHLRDRGCLNINLVTPTHVVPPLLEALAMALGQGLQLPVVYNCGGYESLEALRLLDGIVDIYMPDFKFWDGRWPERFCRVLDYPEAARAALREMHRQVGPLEMDDGGQAVGGLLVRHLVMPHETAGTPEIMAFLARELSPDTYVNVMAQYHPCGRACLDPLLDRRTTAEEYARAVQSARDAGLTRLDGPTSL